MEIVNALLFVLPFGTQFYIVTETRNNRLRPELLPGSNPTVESTSKF